MICCSCYFFFIEVSKNAIVVKTANIMEKKSTKLYECESCFSKEHVRIHTDEKPFESVHDRCAWKSSLKKHLPKHTGEKLCKCEFCN